MLYVVNFVVLSFTILLVTHHPKNLVLESFCMGWNPTPGPCPLGFMFFFPPMDLNPTPNVSPSYLLPTLFYLPPFPLTLPFFHPKHCVATIASPLFPLPSYAPPSPMLLFLFLMPLVVRNCMLLIVMSLSITRSYVASIYVVTSSKKLCC
jgi:hypothetical protein